MKLDSAAPNELWFQGVLAIFQVEVPLTALLFGILDLLDPFWQVFPSVAHAMRAVRLQGSWCRFITEPAAGDVS